MRKIGRSEMGEVARWQDEVTAAEWNEWRRVALDAARRRRQPSASKSAEDFASIGIERLLHQESRPTNVNAWLRTTVLNATIDAWRVSSRKDVRPLSEISFVSDDGIEEFTHDIATTLLGPKTAYTLQESINEVLGFLSEKHQRLILMHAAGFSMAEIAEALEYGSPHAVSNQFRRIRADVQAKYQNQYD